MENNLLSNMGKPWVISLSAEEQVAARLAMCGLDVVSVLSGKVQPAATG